jgi:hypothetical protein
MRTMSHEKETHMPRTGTNRILIPLGKLEHGLWKARGWDNKDPSPYLAKTLGFRTSLNSMASWPTLGKIEQRQQRPRHF